MNFTPNSCSYGDKCSRRDACATFDRNHELEFCTYFFSNKCADGVCNGANPRDTGKKINKQIVWRLPNGHEFTCSVDPKLIKAHPKPASPVADADKAELNAWRQTRFNCAPVKPEVRTMVNVQAKPVKQVAAKQESIVKQESAREANMQVAVKQIAPRQESVFEQICQAESKSDHVKLKQIACALRAQIAEMQASIEKMNSQLQYAQMANERVQPSAPRYKSLPPIGIPLLRTYSTPELDSSLELNDPTMKLGNLDMGSPYSSSSAANKRFGHVASPYSTDSSPTTMFSRSSSPRTGVNLSAYGVSPRPSIYN